ncbi:MAG: bifunctional phosphopantothenoylcysteine decarboxylase/phosphopantothenate--cysteine ligase CoaBC [Bacteroidota bacterium]
MYNYKILFKISGSIAAYKSAYLISKLVQNGFEVKVVTTDYALKFIGKATLEGLTGNRVYTDSFEDGFVMSHINLVKWADLVIVCPASANTINKLANGIADNLLTSLFLAHDWTKPYLIAPAMNTLMYQHPATQSSFKKLEEWGVKILPTTEGYLACGDVGKGKLLEPDEIYERIIISLSIKENVNRKLKVLVTSGGTKENIDGIRFISNLSTGRTGAVIADYFSRRDHNVTSLNAKDAAAPSSICEKISFESFTDLNKKLEELLGENEFDAVIHLAAVSDYSLETIELGDKTFSAPLNDKIDSDIERLSLHLKHNFKIADKLKAYSKNKNLLLVLFKFTNTLNEKDRITAVKNLFSNSNCNFVVLNDRSSRTLENVQNNFQIFDRTMKIYSCSTAFELAEKLEFLFENIHREK